MATSSLHLRPFLKGAKPLPVLRLVRIRIAHADAVSWIASGLLTSAILIVSMSTSTLLLHWFVLPLLLCGVVIGVDLVDWMRGRTDLFDAKGSFGLLGYHFFFIAPLLMVCFNYRMRFLPEQPDDYRDWLGCMAILNFIGLLLYRLIVDRKSSARSLRKVKSNWKLRPQRFWLLWSAFVAASIAAGGLDAGDVRSGISGYLAAYSSWLAGNGDSFAGRSSAVRGVRKPCRFF